MRSWGECEHVLAGPFADLLRKACAEEIEVRASHAALTRHFERSPGYVVTTSRAKYERRYAERYGVTTRTAKRHFKLTLTQPTIPVVIADRVAALVGVPLAYVEATEKEA